MGTCIEYPARIASAIYGDQSKLSGPTGEAVAEARAVESCELAESEAWDCSEISSLRCEWGDEEPRPLEFRADPTASFAWNERGNIGCELPPLCSGIPNEPTRLTRKLTGVGPDDPELVSDRGSRWERNVSISRVVAVHVYSAAKGASYCTPLKTSRRTLPNVFIVGAIMACSQRSRRTLRRRAATTLYVVSKVNWKSPPTLPSAFGIGVQDHDCESIVLVNEFKGTLMVSSYMVCLFREPPRPKTLVE